VLLTILLVHLATAIVSPLLFSARAYRAWRGRDPAVGLLRWLPHAVDTVLFGAGITLAFMTGQNPLVHAWLAAKIIALLCYIAIGHIAVRRLRQRGGIVAAWLLAIAIITYIYAVAFTMRPVPWG
jgi:uncharacterized membrane protein SirB2